MTTTAQLRQRLEGQRETVLWAGVLLNAEAIAVLLYLNLTSVTPTAIRYYLFPLVWINVSIWALTRTDAPTAAITTRKRALAAGLGLAYFLILGWIGGLYSVGGAGLGLTVRTTLPPGWGPALLYSTNELTLTLFPYKLLGYATLAYLVYITVLDAATSAVSGLLGLVSCVSCSWPVAASLLSTVFGGSSAAVSAATSQPYALSTAVFVSAVATLLWRPIQRYHS